MNLALGFLALTACANAQVQNGPVTVAEANTVINKIDVALSKTIGTKANAQLPTNERGLASRFVIIAELGAMFDRYEPYFQYTPRPYTLDKSVIEKFNSDPKTRQTLTRLVRFGCTGTVAPLVVGPSANMSAPDFADALSYFASQIAALTYLADPAWTPNIQRTEIKDG